MSRAVNLSNRLALVVPTKDRPEDLRQMLQSVEKQTVHPAQLIVVDGSRPEVKYVTDSFSGLNIDYVRVFPPSLARQRNAGMARLASDITLAGYLDDDVVLEPDALEEMLVFWETADQSCAGASFNILNAPEANWVWIKKPFGLDGDRRGAVLPSGWTTAHGSPHTNLETDWLCGGATIWRRGVIERYAYDEWFQGMGFLEDVDYSFRIREKHRLVVVGAARLLHNSPPIRADRHVILGKYQVVNRLYFVRKYKKRGLSVRRAWLAIFAMVAMHLAQAVLLIDRRHFNRAWGNVMGIIDELRGREERIAAFLK